MPEQKRHKNPDNREPVNLPLAFFACPNSDCADFNRFDADNLSVAEWMGSACWKKRANVPPTSIACNLKISTMTSKLYRWMNCTANLSRT